MRKDWQELLQVLKHQKPRGAQRCNGDRNPEQPLGAGEDQQHHDGHWPWLALWQMSWFPSASRMNWAGHQADTCDWLKNYSHWQNPSVVAFSTHKQVTYKWSLPTAFPTISNLEMLELWLSCTLILLSHSSIFRKQEHCSKTGQIQLNPTLSNWIMTFPFAQSPSDIFVFFSPSLYNLCTLRHNSESVWPHPLSSSQKTPQNPFSEQLYCLHSAGCNSKPPAPNTVCSHCSSKSHLHMGVMFPQRWQSVLSPAAGEGRSCAVLPTPAFPLPAIVCLLLHLGSRRGRELCPPGKRGPAAPLLEMFHPCSFLEGAWLVRSSNLSPACPRQQREPGTLPLECISHCCVRRVADLHHSWDMDLYTFLNMFV